MRDTQVVRIGGQASGAERDQDAVLALSRIVAVEAAPSELLSALAQLMMSAARARRVEILSVHGDRWVVETSSGAVPIPERSQELPQSLIDSVLRSRVTVALDERTISQWASTDPYLARTRPGWVVGRPVLRGRELVGICYLEGGRTSGSADDNLTPAVQLAADLSGLVLESARLRAAEARALAARQDAEATLRSILENVVDAVYVCDREGQITLASPSGARLLRLMRAEPIRDVEDLAATFRAAHPNGDPFQPDELPLLRALAGEVVSSIDMIVTDPRHGRTAHLRTSAAPLQDEKGAIAGAVAVAVNVTEAVELDRLKEQFIRVVAHEMKTPLTLVKGYADLLRSADDGAAQRRLVEGLVRGVDRIDRLATDLLLFWRLQTGHISLGFEEHVDLVDLVQRLAARLSPPDARRVQIVAPRPVTVVADRQLVERAVLNLVDNAIRYSPGAGEVRVELDIRDDDAIVSVKDRGVGIPHDKQARLFEPFFRAHTDTPYDFGGIGLGLYVARAVVILHGGSIRIESDEGRGTAVRLTLPLGGVRARGARARAS